MPDEPLLLRVPPPAMMETPVPPEVPVEDGFVFWYEVGWEEYEEPWDSELTGW